jgi:tetratricopeptide (TPR) repeat protein
MHSLAAVYFEAGDAPRARETAQLCLDRARAAEDPKTAAIAEVELARVALSDGDARGSLELASAAERSLASIGDIRQQASALRAMGAAYHALGDHTASDQAYLRSIDLVASIDHLATRSVIAAEYAQKLRARGEMDRAFDMLDLARGASAKR